MKVIKLKEVETFYERHGKVIQFALTTGHALLLSRKIAQMQFSLHALLSYGIKRHFIITFKMFKKYMWQYCVINVSELKYIIINRNVL